MRHDPLMQPSRHRGPLFGDPTLTPNPTRIQKSIAGNRHARRRAEAKKPKQHYEVPTATPAEREFRHQHWKPKRDRLLQILPRCGTTQNALQAFHECGAETYVEHDPIDGRYRLRGSHCKSRHCEPCMKAKANILRANLADRLHDRTQYQYRFITLTLKHTDTPLRDQIDRLYSSFKQLRKSKMWKSNQKGGCAILEVKWDKDTGEWHPHLHIMAEGDHMLKAQLSEEWHKATGDSYVVDIKLMAEDKDAAFYVAKYVSKGTNDDVYWNDEAAIEYVCAMKGTRTCATFGSWRGFALMAKPKDDRKWRVVGSINGIIHDAEQGHPYAIKMLEMIRRDLQYNPHRKREPRKLDSPPTPHYTIPSAKNRR